MSWGSEDEKGSGGGAAAGQDVDRPVLLASLFDPVEAEIVMAKLRSAGIECFTKHEALGVIYGLTLDGFGQRDIMVRAGDLEVAKAALEAE